MRAFVLLALLGGDAAPVSKCKITNVSDGGCYLTYRDEVLLDLLLKDMQSGVYCDKRRDGGR